jgi:hypothetical protein
VPRLIDLLTQQRDRQVLERARPHLERDEHIVDWARARHPEKRRHGYAFLTDRKLLVVWSGHSDGHGVVSWEAIDAWGFDCEHQGGPLVGVEFDHESFFVHLPVASQGAAARATAFLGKFARLAPRPRPTEGPLHGLPTEPATVTVPRRSVTALTKRVLLTVIGVVLIAGGLAITPIPGPWSLPVIAAGLAVLASEYDWAKDLLDWVKEKSRRAAEKLKARRAAR